MELTPKQIVRELDRYIIGQDDAKRAVAVALRNRYRRAQLPEEIREEIVPKNILMVGPTGVGKTEIARRLAKLVDAPFIKVEATKFTEVGYVGRDVESIIRDLVEASVRICKEKASQKVKARATVLAEDRIIDLILHPNRKPVNPIDVLLGNKPKQPELPAEEKQRIARKAMELISYGTTLALDSARRAGGRGDRGRGGGRAEGRGDQRREREHRLDDGRYDA